MNGELDDFFSLFETAAQSEDAKAFEAIYASSFMFGGPNGVQTVARDAFLKMLPRIKAQYSSMGLAERKITKVDGQALDPRYLLAKVAWRMGIEGPSGLSRVDISATYILERNASGGLAIVLQIDHQDLAAILRQQLAT